MEVNSGVLLMNLKSFRQYNLDNKFIKFSKSHFLNHHDGTAINVICFNHIKILPLKYNVQRRFYNIGYEKFIEEFTIKQAQEFRYKEEELFEAFYSPVNLHFTGYDKPWDKKEILFKEYWWYYANKTKYMKEIMDAYEFSDLQIKEILSKLNETNTTTIKLNVTL